MIKLSTPPIAIAVLVPPICKPLNNSIVAVIKFKYADGAMNIRGEKIFNGEIHNFISHYGNIKFKCTKIEYHEATKKVKKMTKKP